MKSRLCLTKTWRSSTIFFLDTKNTLFSPSNNATDQENLCLFRKDAFLAGRRRNLLRQPGNETAGTRLRSRHDCAPLADSSVGRGSQGLSGMAATQAG